MSAHGKIARANHKPQPVVAILTTLKAINTLMADVKTRGAALQNDMHILACSVLAHAGKHGDTRPVTKLVNDFIEAVPDMVKVNALKAWFERYGKIEFKEGTAVYVSTKTQRLGEAMEKPFWKLASMEGVAYVPIDMAKWADRQVKALEKDQKETGRDWSALIMSLKTQPATPAPAAIN